MQISTNQFYDRSTSLMQQLTASADKLQTQIATNRKLTAPSDDAVAYQRLAGLHRAASDDTVYAGNIKTAQSLLQQSDTALSAVETQLQQASELAIKAGNGTLSNADRAGIASELNGILDTLVGIAGQDDARGQPLFAAATGAGAVTRAADGSVSFAGTGEPAAVTIGADAAVQAGDSASRVFGNIATTSGTSDVFAIVKKLADALSSGGGAAAVGGAGSDITAALNHVTGIHAAVGARESRLDIEASRLTEAATQRETTRSGLEDTDITAAVTELQKTMTVLQATQASFTKLSQLSLFDYLR